MRLIHVVTAASLLALAGCGVMPVPTGTGSPTGSPSPTLTLIAEPTPTPTEGEILFTISATLTSPVGATARIQQVVYAPTASPEGLDAVAAQLDEECDGWRDRFSDPEYVVGVITTTDTSTGGKKWAAAGQVVVSMAGTAVYEGDYTSFQSYCSSVQALIPADIRGVTPVPADGSPDSAEGWATLTYGFGVATEAGTDATDARYPQLSDCTITVTAAAKALSANATRWATENIGRPGGCEVNTPGV